MSTSNNSNTTIPHLPPIDESKLSFHFDDANDANNLPSVPKLELPQTHEFFNTGTQVDTAADTATNVDTSSHAIANPSGDTEAGNSTVAATSSHAIVNPSSPKMSRKAMHNIISFMNKCIRAKKSLFLLSSCNRLACWPFGNFSGCGKEKEGFV